MNYLLVVGALLLYGNVNAQSFDCQKAASKVEHAICESKALAELDVALAREVSASLAAAPDKRNDLLAAERHWISYRDHHCVPETLKSAESLTECLEGTYRSRIAELQAASRAQPIPGSESTLADAVLFKGSGPTNLRRLPGGELAFTAYTEDGNHLALYILDGPHIKKALPLPLPPGGVPFAWNESFVVAGEGGFFTAIDVNTGARLRRKQFQQFPPPLWSDSGDFWLDGNMLTLISGTLTDSTLRRIRIPDLEVVESYQAPFHGSYVRWGNKIVGLGYWHGDRPYPMSPSIVVFDHNFNILARSEVQPNQPRNNRGCEFGRFAQPAVLGDLLIYDADCGGVRIHNLGEMRQVAARGPIDSPYSLSFSPAGNDVLAFGKDEDGSVLIVDRVSIPALQSTRVARIEGKQIVVSGTTVYAFEGDFKNFRVKSHSLVSDMNSSLSLSDSAVKAQQAAVQELQRSTDLYAAIDGMHQAIPQLSVAEVNSLTPRAKSAMAWYAGLLVQTRNYAPEGVRLLTALHASVPEDKRVAAALEAATNWVKVVNGENQPGARLAPDTWLPLTTGVLPGAVAQSDRYIATSLWCSTSRGANLSLTPTSADDTGAGGFLSRCFAGLSGIAIYDASSLKFRAFIPVVRSDDEMQENVSSVRVLGETAYAAIARRYPDEHGDGTVAVDLRSNQIVARSPVQMGLRVMGGLLYGCTEMCTILGKADLKPVSGATQWNPDDDQMSDDALYSLRNEARAGTVGLNTDYVLTEQLGPRPELRSVSRHDGSSRHIGVDLSSVLGFGLTSPDGRYALVRYMPGKSLHDTAGARLARVEFATAQTVTVGDGLTRPMGPDEPLGGYYFDWTWTDGLLEARDAATGNFVCAWPGLLHNGSHPVTLLYNSDHSALILVATAGLSDDKPSAVMDAGKLVSRARACGEANKAKKAALEKAIEALQ